MSRTPNIRRVLWIVVLGWAGSSGCTHNYYYGTGTVVPGCPPVGQTVTTQVGSVCDVPNGNVVVSGSTASGRSVSSNVGPQPASGGAVTMSTPNDRVVISQPAYGPPSVGQSTSRFKWKTREPEAPPVLKAEGNYEDSTYR